jgi:hypothetical protein
MNRKLIYTIVILLLIALAVFCYVRFVYVFAQGTKAGVLNTFQKKDTFLKLGKALLYRADLKQTYKAMSLNLA